jgi:hypothetical protein
MRSRGLWPRCQAVRPGSDLALDFVVSAIRISFDGRDFECHPVGADQDRKRDGSDSGGSEQPALPLRQTADAAPLDDGPNATLEVGAGYSGGAGEARFDAELADLEDAGSVDVGSAAGAEDFLIAGAFTLIDEAALDPPDERMKPKRGLNEHVDGGSEIVTASHMAALVGDYGVELFRGETLPDGSGKEQALAEKAVHGWASYRRPCGARPTPEHGTGA